jgi:hypothetical protein
MCPGHLYVLSNPAFAADVFKIGLTTKSPETRARGLSRSTAVPTDFKLEHAIPVRNVITAERRVHLLLDPQRINASKEFFKIDRQAAIDACDAIAAYEQEDDTISNEIGLTSRLCGARYHPGTELRTKQLISLMIGATTNNTLFDRIFQVRRGVADGFLTAVQVSEYFQVGAKAASHNMRRLARHGTKTSCHSVDTPPIEAVFDFIRYHKGHLAWRFSNEFREHFSNPKI